MASVRYVLFLVTLPDSTRLGFWSRCSGLCSEVAVPTGFRRLNHHFISATPQIAVASIQLSKLSQLVSSKPDNLTEPSLHPRYYTAKHFCTLLYGNAFLVIISFSYNIISAHLLMVQTIARNMLGKLLMVTDSIFVGTIFKVRKELFPQATRYMAPLDYRRLIRLLSHIHENCQVFV